MWVMSKEEGWRHGVLKGVEASAIREATYSSMRLGFYEPIKMALGGEDKQSTPMWKKFLAGAISGLLSSGLANPSDLLKIRMQGTPPGESYPLKWHVNDVYYNHGGLLGFYAGVQTTVLRAVILNSAYLGSYDSSKYFIINNGYLQDGHLCRFTSTVISGFFVSFFSMPMDNIKTRVMAQRADRDIKTNYKGIADCARKMWKNEGGLIAFFRGIGPNWAGMAPYIVIQLIVWEKLRELCGYKAL